ncbi:LOW QUALITY PROTEIN: uncharacterized protein [Argopecten irradians]|uniref:LOW QUALITY PROTEIN: uncharacterized protein n=1 Tax=Argopecten irradians TaxID=31199 RepID=UPI00371973F6
MADEEDSSSSSDMADDPRIHMADNPRMHMADDPRIQLTDEPRIHMADDPRIQLSDEPRIRMADERRVDIAGDSQNMPVDPSTDKTVDPWNCMADDPVTQITDDSHGDPNMWSRYPIGVDPDNSYESATSDMSMHEDQGKELEQINDDDSSDVFYDCISDEEPIFSSPPEGYIPGMCNSQPADHTLDDAEWESEEEEEVKESQVKELDMDEEKIKEWDINEEAEAGSMSSPQVPVTPDNDVPKPSSMYLGKQAANCAKLVHLSMTTCQEVMREILRHKNPNGKGDSDLRRTLKEWGKKTRQEQQKALLSKDKRKTRRGHQKPSLSSDKRKIMQGQQKSLLSKDEERKLFCGTITYDQLDMSLLYKIARNCLRNNILTDPDHPWDTEPPGYDVSLQACIERLRIFRNEWSHSPNVVVSDERIRNSFKHIRDVVEMTEKHIDIEPQYSLQVDYVQAAELSPDVATLQEQLTKLENERDELRETKMADMEKVMEDLEKQLKRYCSALGMFNTNVNSQDAQTRRCIENHELSDRYYAETRASRRAMEVLTTDHCVLITGQKGVGKTALAYHLLYKLMSFGSCKIHVLDGLSKFDDVNPNVFAIALVELSEIKPKDRDRLTKITKEFISKQKELSLYVILTSKTSGRDEVLHIIEHVDLSIDLNEEEKKRSILTQQLILEVEKTKAPLIPEQTSEEVSEIVKGSSFPLPFPLTASLYAQNEKYRRLGPDFFHWPVGYFLSEVESFCKAEAMYALLLQMVLEETDYDKKEDFDEWLNKQPSNVESAAESIRNRINEHLIVRSRTPNKFRLRNDCVKTALCMYFVKRDVQCSIKFLDLEFVVDTNIVSCLVENIGKCVHVFSCHDDKSVLAKRLLREILDDKSKKATMLNKSDAWLDSEFISSLIDALQVRLRETASENKETEARACIEKLFNWAVSHRCVLLCKGLVKYIGTTTWFPDTEREILKKYMLHACALPPGPQPIADRNISKIDLLKVFVQVEVRCNFCQPLLSCDDNEGLRYLMTEADMEQEPNWGFWKFLKSAAAKGDTMICNCDFLRLLWHPKEDGTNKDEKEELADFAESVKSLTEDSEINKRHFFFSCIETLGLNSPLVQAMKQHKFDLCATNEKGYNGLHVAISSKLPHQQIVNTIMVLALSELDLRQQVDHNGETALMMAVQQEGVDECCIEELLRDPMDPNFSISGGNTALHLCIMSALSDETVSKIASKLIDHGADIYKPSKTGQTPIKLTISKGKSRLKTLGSLVKGGNSHTQATQYMLHYCIQLDLEDSDKEEVIRVLINEGVSVNQADDKGLTPIMLAIHATTNNTNLVWELIDKGADVAATDEQGLSPLHHCCTAQQMSSQVALIIAEWIIQRDDSHLDKPDCKQKTPLMHAITNEKHSTSDLVVYLIEKVTNLEATDSGRNTVLHLLMKSHFEDEIIGDIVRTLLDKNVDPFKQNADSLSCTMCGVTSTRNRVKSISRILEMSKSLYKSHKDLSGCNFLHLCIENDGLSDTHVSELCRQAIQCGESIIAKSKGNQSAVDLAVSSQSVRLKTLCSMLCSSGMKFTCEIYDMVKAANKLSYELLQLLLEYNIELDDECRKERFPFHDILYHSQSTDEGTIVQPLVRLGFDINAKDSRGDNAVLAACRAYCSNSVLEELGNESRLTDLTEKKETYLHLLAKSDRNDEDTEYAMNLLMQITKVKVNQVNNYKRSALAESVIKQKVKSVRFLLQQGADPNKSDRDGKTTVHHCIAGDWFDDKACEMLDILAAHKADVEICDNKSSSALTMASSHSTHSRLFTILRLLELGVDVCDSDQWGSSPISNCLIHLRGHRKATVVERAGRLTVLRMYGVEPFCKDNNDKTAVDLCDKLAREKELLQVKIVDLSKFYEDIVKGAFASLDGSDNYHHIAYPVKKLKPRVLQLLKYSAKLLHRKMFDVCKNDVEHDEDLNTLNDFLGNENSNAVCPVQGIDKRMSTSSDSDEGPPA